MNERLEDVKIGDIIRIITYTGTTMEGYIPITSMVHENRFRDRIFEPLDEKDGLNLVGVYLGRRIMCENQEQESYLQLQVLSQNARVVQHHNSRSRSNYPDLIIPERLVRRYETLKLGFSSDIFPLRGMENREI